MYMLHIFSHSRESSLPYFKRLHILNIDCSRQGSRPWERTNISRSFKAFVTNIACLSSHCPVNNVQAHGLVSTNKLACFMLGLRDLNAHFSYSVDKISILYFVFVSYRKYVAQKS